ncbi:MAG TPA: aldehyde dehydrogenase family protein [Anaerolineales bacterium]|nr:aldehyde dehydrogenase family protein [Anaerolineales bacterium]
MRAMWINSREVGGNQPPQIALNPATEEAIGESAWGGLKEADTAIAAARAAFQTWRITPAPERAAMLHEVARRMRQNLENLALELTLETGRSIRKNRGYVEWSAQCFDYYAEIGRHYGGRLIPSPESSQLSIVLKVPLGVIAAIVPWNYPLLLLAWKLAPALAAGNTVVIKPATYTSWVTLGFAQYFEHFPPGVINILTGSGSEVGDYMVTHPDVRMIAFTGSTEVGQHIMRQAATDMKHIHLELGGKDPLIVCADAEIEAAARASVWGGFLNAGQVCTSVERVYVELDVYPQLLHRIVELTNQLVIGPGVDPESEVTPMIRPVEREKVSNQVELAAKGGAKVLTGGRIPSNISKGFYYEPTVLSDVNENMLVMQEETFGPVLPVVPIRNLDEALNRANRSHFGLGATLFTNDARKVKRYMETIEVGNVWVNDPLIDNIAGPFGGMKRSGIGRELGMEGFEEFLETKHVHWEIEGGIKSWWYPWE